MAAEITALPPQVEQLLDHLELHAARVLEQPVHVAVEEFTAADLALTAQMLVRRTRTEPELAWSADWVVTLQMFADLYRDERAPRPGVWHPRRDPLRL